jgi:hypothetical protein
VSALSIRWGDGALGAPIMKFPLVFDGELASNGGYKKKWEIRKQFHPQLQELWRLHPSLARALERRYMPSADGVMYWETHHEHFKKKIVSERGTGEDLDLCETIKVGNREFFPLVRKSFALNCGLKVLFLRKEDPGKVYQGGDMDNRLKTLFDSLSIPNDQQIVDDPTMENPIYCLLEDDALITSCEIDTKRLLSRPNASPHEVHLVIDVDVRVTQSRMYNQPFLGD